LLVLATVQNQPVALTAAEPSVIEPGTTLEELAERTGCARAHLRTALAGELELGRVELGSDGRYRIVAAAFSLGVLDALLAFTPSTTAELAG
jgi:DNA-binding IclR family transcriptional regulator